MAWGFHVLISVLVSHIFHIQCRHQRNLVQHSKHVVTVKGIDSQALEVFIKYRVFIKKVKKSIHLVLNLFSAHHHFGYMYPITFMTVINLPNPPNNECTNQEAQLAPFRILRGIKKANNRPFS